MKNTRSKLCVITPFHKLKISDLEKEYLKISLSHLSEAKHVFVVPNDSTEEIFTEFPRSEVVKFSKSYFESKMAYNSLMLSKEFYEEFISFDHVLILQTDAIIVKDFPYSLCQKFDYIGAPWSNEKKLKIWNGRLWENTKRLPFKRAVKVAIGNGGLSLRRVSVMLDLVNVISKDYSYLVKGFYNEDLVLSYFLTKIGYEVPTPQEAEEFFCETGAIAKSFVPNSIGFHALGRVNPKLESEILDRYRVKAEDKLK